MHWSEIDILILLLCNYFTVYISTIKDLTVTRSSVNDLSYKFNSYTLTTMHYNNDLTI